MLHSIIGLQNCGKSLKLTLDGFLGFCSGKTIISNYNLKFPHYLINREMLAKIVEDTINIPNVLYLLDEFWLWNDSRNSEAIMSHFYLQTSKDGSSVLVTAQGNDQNDRRFRKNCNKVTKCKRVLLVENKFYDIDSDERFLPEEYNDILYIECEEYRRKEVGLFTEMFLDNTYYIPAKQVFRLYNTTQKIKSKGVKK